MSRIERAPSDGARTAALAFAQLTIQRSLPIEGPASRAWVSYLLLVGRLFKPWEAGVWWLA